MRDRFTRERARELRHRLTEAERHLWLHIRKHNLGCRFRRQVPIGPYIADFACLDLRIVVEVDGRQHIEQSAYDVARDGFIREQGFVVLRFWSNEVLQQTEAVLQVIWVAIQEKKLPPSSPSDGQEPECRGRMEH